MTVTVKRRPIKKALDIYENDQLDEMEENPSLELHYIECLYLNNQSKKAKLRLEELKSSKKGDSFFESITIEELMEGYRIIKRR